MVKPSGPWRQRAVNLLRAVRDVAPDDHPPSSRARAAPGPHRALFDDYLRDLGEARQHANGWIQSIIDKEEDRTGDRQEAIRIVSERRPVGAVAHGVVIATVRRYWLACDALNREADPPRRVAPEDLVLGWLVEEGHDDLAEFLAGLPYWPIGLDTDDHWV
jgi:hypothetical protein